MSESKFNQRYLDETVQSLQMARKQLDTEDEAQEILNARRQSTYNMEYTDWANRSIRVMASYTVLLVILLLVLSITFVFGSQIKGYVTTFASKVPGLNG